MSSNDVAGPVHKHKTLYFSEDSRSRLNEHETFEYTLLKMKYITRKLDIIIN